MKHVLEASSLKIGYSDSMPLYECINTIQLKTGQLTSLLGLNGAGKSTLLRTLCGLLPPLVGDIIVLGRALKDYSQSELATVIGVVLTDRTNAGGITVRELVSLGRYPYTGFFGRLNNNDRRLIDEALDATGMLFKANSSVLELSDGERQKVMIAKVLAQQCPIIILDEPTAFLDVTSRLETIALLRRLTAEQGKTVLMSTHDLDTAIQMSDCLWLLRQGEALRSGTPEDLILSGDFGNFFDRDDIRFDVASGKLTAKRQLHPVIVEGDDKTAFWVGNALIRNGFSPVDMSVTDIECRIVCHAPDRIAFIINNEDERLVSSVAQLIEALTINKV
jgi:iron complex transport system ATP-binding protein